MTRPFDFFVVLAEMRTGSNLLESLLNRIPGVTCHGEAYNLNHLGGARRRELLGITIDERDRDPAALLAAMAAQPGLNGFRLFHDHDLRMLDRLLDDPRCAKIVLSRNPVESWVSLEIARETQNWMLTDIRRRRVARATFRAAAFDAFLAARAQFRGRIMHALQRSGQTAFFLDYEDLRDGAVLAGLGAWLGHPGGLDGAASPMLVQNPEPLADKVANWPEMARELARLDYFGLTRLPNFEPRRGPAPGALLAASGVPLLFLPFAPEPRLEAWLGALGGAPAETGFTQATLADWKAANPDFRSFALLRHPLDRADRAFRDTILGGLYPRVRAILVRDFGLRLPPAEEAGAITPAAYREALLAFLRFLRLNLNGQTPVRVDRFWCSQSEVLRGMADCLVPDRLCRAERLEADLAALAEAAGVPAPPLPAEAPAGPVALAEVADDTLEEAAAAAYARDMRLFGFGRWRPVR